MLEFASKPPPRDHGGTDRRLGRGVGFELDPIRSLERAKEPLVRRLLGVHELVKDNSRPSTQGAE